MASLNSYTLRLSSSPGMSEPAVRAFLDGCVSPLLTAIARSEKLRVNLLISGLLLDAAAVRTDILASLRELAREGRIELLAGFYTEPCLSSVSGPMRKLQLEHSVQSLSKLGLGVPAGIALPGFTWEPEILDSLEGFRYVALEERCLPETDRWVSYRLAGTELTIFPLSQQPGAPRKSARQLEAALLYAEIAAGFSGAWERANAETLAFLENAEGQGAAFVLNRDLLSLEAPFEISALSLRTAPRPSLSDKAELLLRRAHDLESEFRSLPEVGGDERSAAALRNLLLTQHRETRSTAALEQPAFRSWFYDAALCAQVAIDALREPDVDPTVGWVRLDKRDFDENGIEDFVIDTQLARWYITGGGQLTEFDYKPRKLNLCDVIGRGAAAMPSLEPFFCFEERGNGLRRAAPQLNAQGSLVTKRTLDLLTLRLSSAVSSAPWRGTFIKDITFKAGVGAHLSNSTTGFSLEYWLEGDAPPPPDLLLGVTLHLRLPTAEQTAIRAKPLLPVGAVSEESFLLDAEAYIPSPSVPGGIFGIRLIDGLQDLTVDIRSAKQLSSVTIAPVLTASSAATPLFQGMRLEFIAEARRLYTDDRTNTLFLSVV